jgi:hypothetical protein
MRREGRKKGGKCLEKKSKRKRGKGRVKKGTTVTRSRSNGNPWPSAWTPTEKIPSTLPQVSSPLQTCRREGKSRRKGKRKGEEG